jgi:hypothetical protein
MNLVQLANDLEYVPRKELAEMSQDPNSSYPAYLVLSEIQRRTLNDKNFAAMQERPTTTVAEEVVDEFMQPQLAENQSQGLQGGTPQSATPLPDSNISAGLSGVPTAPMQMAASGGRTGYAEGNQTALEESFNNPYENMSAQAQGMTGAGMGMDALGDNLEAAIEQYGVPALKTLGIINDDNSVNYGTLALQALSLNPAMRLGRGALGIAGAGLSRFAPKTMSSLKGLPSKIKNRFTSPVSKVDESLITSGSIQTDRVFDAAKSGKTLLNTAQNLAIPALVAKSMLSNGEETVVKQELTEEQLKIQELERQLAERENLKGLAGATAEKDNTGNWRDLARLGAGIMSAKNVSDIGGTVTNILDAQDKRGLVGLQSKFTQAQTDQILATTKAMPLEQKLATLQSLGKLFEKISSGEIEVTEEQKASYALQYQILNDEVLKMQGIASSGSKFLTEAEQKIFNQAKAG